MNCFSLKAKNAMISRTSKLLEIYGLDGLEPKQFPKLSYPVNPEVVSIYSFQIYVSASFKPKCAILFQLMVTESCEKDNKFKSSSPTLR
jgi:hypothetical protein